MIAVLHHVYARYIEPREVRVPLTNVAGWEAIEPAAVVLPESVYDVGEWGPHDSVEVRSVVKLFEPVDSLNLLDSCGRPTLYVVETPEQIAEMLGTADRRVVEKIRRTRQIEFEEKKEER